MSWIDIFQRIHTNGQQAQEKMLHLSVRGMQIKTKVEHYVTAVGMAIIEDQKWQMLARMWRKGNLCKLLVRMQNGAATVESSGGFSKY